MLFTAVLTGLFALVIIAIQVTSSVFTQGYLKDNIFSFHKDVDESICTTIDEVVYSYARMVREDNQQLLNNLNSNNSRTVRAEALQQLVTVGEMSTIFADVGWRDVGGFLSVNGYISPNESVFLQAAENKNSIIVGEYKNGCIPFVVHMKIDITQTEGAFVFYMDESALSSSYAILGSEAGYSYIISKDGYILSHEDKDLVGKILYYSNMYQLDVDQSADFFDMNGENKYVLTSYLERVNELYGFNYHVVSVMNYDYYYGTYQNLTVVLSVLACVIFAVGVILAIILAKRLSTPIAELDANIEGVMRTGKKVSATAKKGDELYNLEQKYDEMMDKIFALMEKSREDADSQRKLELDALQMQINPHFLYNTLDAISWMAKIKKEEEIESIAVNLAKFFRLSLHKGDKFITVGEELELTAHYVQIYNIRYPGKVKVIINADEQVKNYKTLKLILQPIVENSLKYAFVERDGQIEINVYGDGDDIVFEVIDDGSGFEVSDDVIYANKEKESLGGFGIYNVNERIRLEYGEAYGLKIDSAANKGTKVVITIAKRI